MAKLDLSDNTAMVFKNDRKTEDWHAEYRGEALVEGKRFWLDIKIMESKAGNKFLKGTFKVQEEPAKPESQPPKQSVPDIPF